MRGKTNALIGGGGGGSTPTQEMTVQATSFPTIVEPDAGYALSKATVTAPDNLSAENIKSGVSIAGINGTYVGSSTAASVDMVNGYCSNNTVAYPPFVCYIAENMKKDPERMTELDFSNTLSNSTSDHWGAIQYGSGAIFSKAQPSSPNPMTSTYVPSVSSYNYYKDTLSVTAGEYTFSIYLQGASNVYNSPGFSPSHIVGDMYLYPMCAYYTSVSSTVPNVNNGVYFSSNWLYGYNSFQLIHVDCDITKIGSTYTFQAEIPEDIETDIAMYQYSTCRWIGAQIATIPLRVVIS